jgi:hypothetical protein
VGPKSPHLMKDDYRAFWSCSFHEECGGPLVTTLEVEIALLQLGPSFGKRVFKLNRFRCDAKIS